MCPANFTSYPIRARPGSVGAYGDLAEHRLKTVLAETGDQHAIQLAADSLAMVVGRYIDGGLGRPAIGRALI